jgi:hypothetical protein
MKNRSRHFIQAIFLIFIFSVVAVPAWAAEISAKGSPPDNWFIYIVIFIVLIGSLLSILIICMSLSNSEWSLSNALSEAVEITEICQDGKPVMDSSNKPLMATKIQPSSNRMVALMGMIVI